MQFTTITVSSKDKARLRAIGDIMARAAKPADTSQKPRVVEGCPSRSPEDRKAKGGKAELQARSAIQSKPAVRRDAPPAPPDQASSAPRNCRHLTRLKPFEHERLLKSLSEVLGLPDGATDQVPVVFQDLQIRPMKIGIFHDLVERFRLEDPDAQKQLRFVLRGYLTRKLAYQRALLKP